MRQNKDLDGNEKGNKTVTPVTVSRKRKKNRRVESLRSKAERAKAAFNAHDPDDVLFDPRYGMAVSRQGKDRGAKQQPLRDRMVELGGERVLARGVQETIWRLWREGNIGNDEYLAARWFQIQFDRAGHDRCSTTNLTGAGRGKVDREEIMAHSKDAADYCSKVLKALGGIGAPLASVVVAVVGHRKSIREFSKKEVAGNRDYWAGIFRGALHIMAMDIRHHQVYGKIRDQIDDL